MITTKTKSKEQVQERINMVKERLDILNKVTEVLRAKFNGKQLSKRIETALTKEFPDYHFSFTKSYSWYELQIWSVHGKGSVGYQDLRANLGYFEQSEGILDIDFFIKQNQCYFLDATRLPVYQKDLAEYDERVAALIQAEEAYNKAESALGIIRG